MVPIRNAFSLDTYYYKLKSNFLNLNIVARSHSVFGTILPDLGRATTQMLVMFSGHL